MPWRSGNRQKTGISLLSLSAEEIIIPLDISIQNKNTRSIKNKCKKVQWSSLFPLFLQTPSRTPDTWHLVDTQQRWGAFIHLQEPQNKQVVVGEPRCQKARQIRAQLPQLGCKGSLRMLKFWGISVTWFATKMKLNLQSWVASSQQHGGLKDLGRQSDLLVLVQMALKSARGGTWFQDDVDYKTLLGLMAAF